MVCRIYRENGLCVVAGKFHSPSNQVMLLLSISGFVSGSGEKLSCSCINTVLLQLLSRISAGRAGCGTDLAKCVLAAG